MKNVFFQKLQRKRRTASVKKLMGEVSQIPLVSFILPVYNEALYLPQAMDCLLAQTLKHIEIICVDDGSTDNSLEILRRYEKQDSRVKVFAQENQYAGIARSTGFMKARGEYVCFLDADDFFEKDLAEKTWIAAKTDFADVVIFDADCYDNATATYGAERMLCSKYIPTACPFNRDDCPDTLYQITSPCVWNKLFRRQFLLDIRVQFSPLRRCNDLCYVYSALAMAQRIVALEQVLVHHRTGLPADPRPDIERDTISFYLAYWALYRKLKEQELLNQLRRTYVNAALDCCIRNWQAQQEQEKKNFIENKLRAHIFREMELNGYDKSYYYVPAHYDDMQTILGEAAAQEVRATPGKGKSSRGFNWLKSYIYIYIYGLVGRFKKCWGQLRNKEKLQALQAENRHLAEQVRRAEQRRDLLVSALLLAVDPGQTTARKDTVVQHLAQEQPALAFLDDLYRLKDALIDGQRMEIMEREFAALALGICMDRLNAEQDPATKQLIYDALKNEAFDELALADRESDFFDEKADYCQMRQIIDMPYKYSYFSVLSKPFYEKALEKWYFIWTDRKLNLKNPVTYNDKLNWMKLYEHDPRKTLYSDKYAVRDYVAKTIGEKYLVPLLGVWDDPGEIDFNRLPDRFVLKANHSSGCNLVVRNKAILDIPKAVKKMQMWLQKKQSFHNLELHYDGIKPRIVAEEYLENTGGELDDYKVWCFHGKAYYILYITDRQIGTRLAFFDLNWNKMPWGNPLTRNVEKPDNLEELIQIAEKLAADFNHVRVDFYRLNNGQWKFGEMTFTHSGGRAVFRPEEVDEIFGELLELPDEKKSYTRDGYLKGGETPLVSFILPVYNVAAYLPQALDSLLCQTLKHIEIICVDDGSTDNSLQILRSYEKKDPRVKVFTQKNQYAGVARNHGLSKATGEYVCFLDADDFFEKDLAEQTWLAAKTDQTDVVIFNADRYNNATGEFADVGRLLRKKFVPLKSPFNRNDCPDTLYQITTPCSWTKLFRRQFLLDTGLQFQALHNTNDLLLVHSAIAMAERIVVVDKNLVHYRVGMDTNLQATKSRAPMCFYEAYMALHNKLKEQDLLEQLRRTYVNVALGGCIHEWKTQTDPQARQMLEQFLRIRGFRELEILGHEKKYYYAPEHYEIMQQILSGTVQEGTV